MIISKLYICSGSIWRSFIFVFFFPIDPLEAGERIDKIMKRPRNSESKINRQ